MFEVVGYGRFRLAGLVYKSQGYLGVLGYGAAPLNPKP